MRVEVYAIAHNEEFIMPYFIRHYKQFCDEIIILENNSTDNTVKVAKELGATVIELDIPDNKDNQTLADIKNHCWKKSIADWVIVIDIDEFIYSFDVRESLKGSQHPIIRTTWCEMYSDTIPSGNGQIYDEVNKGLIRSPYGSKLAIFKPDQIESMNWGVGCHNANPIAKAGYYVSYFYSSFKTLHFRHLSLEYVLMRNRTTSVRLSNRNRKMGWSVQYDRSRDHVEKHFTKALNESVKII